MKYENEIVQHGKYDFWDANATEQGPGKFSGIRTSLAVAKALALTNRLNLYGFSSKDLKNANYKNIIDLYRKGMLTKNLINTIY